MKSKYKTSQEFEKSVAVDGDVTKAWKANYYPDQVQWFPKIKGVTVDLKHQEEPLKLRLKLKLHENIARHTSILSRLLSIEF